MRQCAGGEVMYRWRGNVQAMNRLADRGEGGKCPEARQLLGTQQGPQSTLSTYENNSIQAV